MEATTKARLKSLTEETHDAALEGFIRLSDEIDHKVVEVRAAIDEHLWFDYDDIGWTHVGIAGRINRQLGELLATIRDASIRTRR